MATVVQTATGAFSGTTATAIFSSPVTAGNAIIVLRTSWEFDESGSVRTYTVTDNKGGTNADYVAISDQYIDPLYSPLWSHQIWGIANSAGGSGTADRKSTRLNSSHVKSTYAVFCIKKKIKLAK